MEDDKRPRGRPTGKDYGTVKSVRFTEKDAAVLRAFAEEWGCSEAAVLRRLLRDAAKAAARRSK